MRFISLALPFAVALAVIPAFAEQAAKNAKNSPKAAAAPAAAKSSKAPKAPEPDAEQLSSTFREFCGDWMTKLSERETRNLGLIEWDKGLDWVQGTYTGFAPEHTCLVDGVGANAIGKMTYREVKYEKRGKTVEDAQTRPPHAIEVTEVTEIFRFEKGKWVY